MSNLATMIMEGSGMGYSAKLDHSYGVDDGAGLIAMESAEALKDIFEAEFYVPNTCTIAAALEGVSVEESSQASVMEASIKGAFAKIKEFFIKLKEKVKDFLHNIKRYLLGIFGSDEKWVTKYEKDIMAISAADLKGYKVKMYNYHKDLDGEYKVADIDAFMKDVKDGMNAMYQASFKKGVTDRSEYSDEEVEDKCKASYEKWLADLVGKSSIDPEEIDKEIWSMLRSGADNESDKEDVEVAGKRKEFIDAVKNSKKAVSKIDSTISKIDSTYKKVIKFIDDTEKEVSKIDDKAESISNKLVGQDGSDNENNMINATVRNSYAKCLRCLSKYTSKEQNVMNKFVSAHKAALVERNKAYKSALTGIFAYARKNKSK